MQLYGTALFALEETSPSWQSRYCCLLDTTWDGKAINTLPDTIARKVVGCFGD
jgi:hypothetical protein